MWEENVMMQKKTWMGVLCSVFLLGCTGYDKNALADHVAYHITANGKTAFASEVVWDLSENAQYSIPEKVDKAAVKKLGGFFGTGVPAPFQVIAEKGYEFQAYDPYMEDYGSPIAVKQVPVTVSIPKTIEEVRLVSEGMYYGMRNPQGELVFLFPSVSLNCDPDNPDFYSENGILFTRETKETAADLTGSQELSPTLAQRLAGRYVKENEEDAEVIEFFTEFDTLFSHTNWYMEGSEYMFGATEYTPLNPDSLKKSDADSVEVSAKLFSEFANAGQYTESDSPYYRIEAKEDGIVILALDENRKPYMDSGIELKRDMSQPSQFPSDFSEWPFLFREGETPMYRFYSSQGNIAEKARESTYARMKLHADGAVTVQIKDSEAPLCYRGIAAAVYNRETSESDLCFALTAVGGTMNPQLGRVRIETKDRDTFVLHRIEGYEAWPLIPDGEEECVWN